MAQPHECPRPGPGLSGPGRLPHHLPADAADRAGLWSLDHSLEPRSRPSLGAPPLPGTLNGSMQRLNLSDLSMSEDNKGQKGRATRTAWSPLPPLSARSQLSFSALNTLPLDVTFDVGNMTCDDASILDGEFRTLLSEYIALENSCRTLEEEHKTLLEEYNDVFNRLEKREEAIQAMDKNRRWYEARITTLELEAEELDHRYTQLWESTTGKLQGARQELEENDAMLLALNNANRLKRRELDVITCQAANAQKALASLRKKAVAVDQELTDLKQRYDLAVAERCRHTQMADELGVALEGTQQQLKTAEQQLQDYQTDGALSMMEAELALLTARVQERETRLDSLKQELSCERTMARNEMDTLRKRLLSTYAAHSGVTAAPKTVNEAVDLLQGLMAQKCTEFGELLVVCDQLLSTRSS